MSPRASFRPVYCELSQLCVLFFYNSAAAAAAAAPGKILLLPPAAAGLMMPATTEFFGCLRSAAVSGICVIASEIFPLKAMPNTV